MTKRDDPDSAIEIAAQTRGAGRGDFEPPGGSMSPPKSIQTRITRADNGFEITLDEMIRTSEHPLLWSVDERMRLTKRRATGRAAIRSREVFRVSLASGRKLDLSSGQHVLKVDGWKPLTELSAGSRIAVLRRLSEPVQLKPMHASEVIMLAHMIGDGSCVKRQPVRYASIHEANLMAVTAAAAHFGVTPIRDEYAAARVTTLRLPAPFRLTHGKRNPIAEWLDGLGLFGQRSYEKFVPAEVFALSQRAGGAVLTAPMGYRWFGPLGREDFTGTGLLRLDQSPPD
jgi:replicative DNA helicase